MPVKTEIGLMELAGSLEGGVILTELLARFQKHREGARRDIKFETLADMIESSEEETIAHLQRLIEEKHLERVLGSVDLEVGTIIRVTGISLMVDVSKPQKNLDFGKESPAPIKLPNRLDKYEREEMVDGVTWKGVIIPQHLSDTSDDVVACKLSITGDDLVRVADHSFDGVLPVRQAWKFFEEYIQFVPDISDWVAEEAYIGRPLNLDVETFQAVFEFYKEQNPDSEKWAETMAKALVTGTFRIDQGETSLIFKRDPNGLRWPKLPANADTPNLGDNPGRSRPVRKKK